MTLPCELAPHLQKCIARELLPVFLSLINFTDLSSGGAPWIIHYNNVSIKIQTVIYRVKIKAIKNSRH